MSGEDGDFEVGGSASRAGKWLRKNLGF